jgi:hypothetical protein
VVDTPEDYQAWLKERAELAGTQTAPSPSGPSNSPQGTVPPPAAPKTENKPAATAAPSPSPSG